MAERYFHTSNVASLRLQERPRAQKVDFKPNGFWFDVNGDWYRWLRGEEYLDNPAWNRPVWYEVVIPPELRILRLTSAAAIRDFDLRWQKKLLPELELTSFIDWREVAAQWDGIVIAPYVWSLRLSDVRWYYAWDCASGCVWRGQDQLTLRPVTQEEVAACAGCDDEDEEVVDGI